MRVIIVGGGIMGLASAWGLTRAGAEIELYEQGPLPNPRASSYDSHRLIRYPYGNHHGYRLLVSDAYAAWDRLWSDLGRSHYVETGTLIFGPPDSPWISASLTDMVTAETPLGLIGATEVHGRAPDLHLLQGEEAWFTPSGGVLLADRIVDDLIEWLRRNGARLRPETRVTAVDPAMAVVTLEDGSTRQADHVLTTTGAWGPLDGTPPAFTPSRQILRYFDVPAPSPWSSMPMLLGLGQSSGFYLVPPVAGTALKIGDHHFTMRGHPDDDRIAHADEVRDLDRIILQRFPGLANHPRRSYVCHYSVTEDERFIASRMGRSWSLRGFSGHGFKFGALVGLETAAAMSGHLDVKTWSERMAGHVRAGIDAHRR